MRSGRLRPASGAHTGDDASTDGRGGSDGAGDADALPADLVAYFPLDGTFDDLVGGPAGTCTPAQCPVAQVAGHLGAAMRFDGADDCVSIQDLGQFDLPQLTVSIWANEDAPLAIGECQVSKRVDGSGGPLDSWQLETIATPTQEALTSDHSANGNDQIGANNTITAGAWQHIVATFDGFNELLYVDGALVGMGGNSAALRYGTFPVLIGCDDNGTLQEHYQGMLDELRVYKRALTQAEIQNLP